MIIVNALKKIVKVCVAIVVWTIKAIGYAYGVVCAISPVKVVRKTS